MLLTFHAEFDQVFVAYVSTYLPTYFLRTYQLICFFAYIHLLVIEEKKHHSGTRHVTPKDQTYCFDYFVAVKL